MEILLESIQKRFGEVLTKQNFIIASCIDPKFYFSWVKDDAALKQLCINAFENLSLQCMCPKIAPKNSEATDIPNVENHDDDFLYDFEVQTPMLNSNASSLSEMNENNCIREYMKTPIFSLKDYTPCLKQIYLQYNTPLPSSDTVERIFSICGDILRKKRNRLTDENFEANVTLKHAILNKQISF